MAAGEMFYSLTDRIGNWMLNFGKRGIQGSSYMLGQKGAVWINVLQPWMHYNEIPALKTVIDRRASMFSNMEILIVDKEGNRVEDPELQKLLNNPNCEQSQNDFLNEYQTQLCVYGNEFIYGNRASSLLKYPVALWNVSARYVKPYMTGKVFDQVDNNGIISKYEYTMETSFRSFLPNEILFTKIKDLDNPIVGKSPIFNLKFPLSNTKAAYEYRNVIMTEKGAIGILSNETKDAMGSVPLTPEEKSTVEKQYGNEYGISEGQRKVILTNAALKWQPMTYETSKLMLFEEVDANKRDIIDAYGLNQNIFSSMQGVTYENFKNGMVMSYQDTIQPAADSFVQSLGKFLKLPEGIQLKASYEHLSILKENKLKGMQAIEAIVRSLTEAVQGGLISRLQAETILANELGVPVQDDATNKDKTINKLNSMSPLVATKVLESFTINEQRSLVEYPGITGGEERATPTPSNTFTQA